MISDEMAKALNDQINAEMYSAYLYLSMSAWFETQDLPGMANWMKIQYQEETAHAMRLFTFVHERGGKVVLDKIEAPKNEWETITQVFEETLKHEEYITSRINKLVTISRKCEDYATESFLSWYVDEQVEEEATANEILTQVRRVENHPGMLFMVDKELSNRTYTPPVDAKA